MHIEHFADIEQEFIKRAHSMVWCNVAMVDAQGRPNSRILHPIWEGAVGWVATYRHSPKNKYLADNPYVSIAYVSDWMHPAYVDCMAEWVDDLAVKQHVWNLFTQAAPPLGYDPTPIFHSPDHANFGVLRFTPWRIQLTDLGQRPYSRLWQARSSE